MDGAHRPTNETPRLFFLRLWREELAQGHVEWRGQMTSLANGEVRYFRNPATLYNVLLTMLSDEPAGIRTSVSSGEEGESTDDTNIQEFTEKT
jgi:hypothetical protein